MFREKISPLPRNSPVILSGYENKLWDENLQKNAQVCLAPVLETSALWGKFPFINTPLAKILLNYDLKIENQLGSKKQPITYDRS